MSEKQSKGVQKQKEKGGNKVAFTVGGAVVIVAIVVIVILVLVNRSGGMEEDNLPTVPIGENANVQGTLVDESYSAPDPEDDTVGFGYYESHNRKTIKIDNKRESCNLLPLKNYSTWIVYSAICPVCFPRINN